MTQFRLNADMKDVLHTQNIRYWKKYFFYKKLLQTFISFSKFWTEKKTQSNVVLIQRADSNVFFTLYLIKQNFPFQPLRQKIQFKTSSIEKSDIKQKKIALPYNNIHQTPWNINDTAFIHIISNISNLNNKFSQKIYIHENPNKENRTLNWNRSKRSRYAIIQR